MTALLEKKPDVFGTAGSSMPAPGIAFPRLFHVELRKQIDTRAGRALLAIIGVITVLVLTVLVFVSEPSELTLMMLFDAALMPQMMILPVLGVLAMTSEWSQRTGLTTFTLESRRTRVIGAKVVSALALGALVLVMSLALAALANLAAQLLRDAPGVWSLDGSGVAGLGLMEFVVISQGLAFGLLLLNTPAAIVTYYVLPTIWTVLLTAVSWFEPVREWLDLSMASSSLLDISAMGSTEWMKLLVAVLIWVALPLVLGTVRVLRREVK